jgi:hypothetical protein
MTRALTLLHALQPDTNLAELEKQRRELQAEVETHKQQILSLEEDLGLADNEKRRLEGQISQLNEKLSNDSKAALEEAQAKAQKLQRRVTEMADELDQEKEARQKTTAERRKLESDLKSITEQLEEEQRCVCVWVVGFLSGLSGLICLSACLSAFSVCLSVCLSLPPPPCRSRDSFPAATASARRRRSRSWRRRSC